MSQFPAKITLTLGALLAASSAADAQHLDVLAYDAGGTVGVGELNFDTLKTIEKRVFLARLDSFYSVNNPGFAALSGTNSLPGSADLEWDFLPMTVDSGEHEGYASNLLYWDGLSDDPMFGPTPTKEYEFSLFGEHGPAAADGGDAVVTGGVIDRTAPNGAIHIHRYYFLDDNGDGQTTTLPAPGIYLVGMRLRIAGLEPSDPFYFAWATPELEVLPAIQPAAAWVRERVDTLFVDELSGDFNGDGTVDAADYPVWHDGLGVMYDAADYGGWLANFGATSNRDAADFAVPELPANALALLAGLVGVSAGRIRPRSTCRSRAPSAHLRPTVTNPGRTSRRRDPAIAILCLHRSPFATKMA